MEKSFAPPVADQRHTPLDAGAGIRLELIDEHHLNATFDLISKNSRHLSEWLPWVSNMQTPENVQHYIRVCRQQHEAGTDLGYLIFLNKQLVGRIGLHYIHPQNRFGAIGYWLDKDFEGQGIVTRSCTALIRHAFTVVGLNRIEIKCGTANRKSAAIPERLGFTKEGVLRQSECLNGGFIDLSLYSLLKEEWAARF